LVEADLNTIVIWIGYLKESIIFLGLLAAAFLTYTKFVIERGIFPPVQFWIECKTVGQQGDRVVLEILLHLKNLGSSVLVATNICIEVWYLRMGDAPEFLKKNPGQKHLKGRLCFPHCLKDEVVQSKMDSKAQGETYPKICGELTEKEPCDHKFHLLNYDTFIKPSVDQVYTFITSVPKSTTYVRIFASFKYPENPSILQRYCLNLGRLFGLINYTLEDISEPHTCERAFKVELKEDKSKEHTEKPKKGWPAHSCYLDRKRYG
jgi:hypothetical protein